MGDYITISEGLFITFISVISVFIILVVISILIMGLKTIGEEEEKEEKMEKPVLKAKKEEIPQENAKETYKEEDEGLDEELVAVIASALACSMGLDLPDINIKSIKRISRDTDEWSKASKVEQVSKTIY